MSTRPIKILIVDRCGFVRHALQRVLKLDHEVLTAVSVIDIMSVFDREDIDVLVCDLHFDPRVSARVLLDRMLDKRPETARVLLAADEFWVMDQLVEEGRA